MLLLTLAPFLFSSYALALTLNLTDGQVISPNSSVRVAWTRTGEAGPLHFILSLAAPNGTVTTNEVIVKADQNSGIEKMSVGLPGSYLVRAINLDPRHPVSGSLSFDVEDPATSTNSTTATTTQRPSGTSGTTSSTTTRTSPATTSLNTTTGCSSDSSCSSTISSSADGTSTSNIMTSSASTDTSLGVTTHPMPPLSTALPTTSSSSSSPTSSSRRSVIIGSVIGGIAFLAIVVVILLFWRKRKQRDERPVIFDRDLMVRNSEPASFPPPRDVSDERGIGPTLAARDKEMYLMAPMDATATISGSSRDESVHPAHDTSTETSSTVHMRKQSNPFRDAALMSRFSKHFDDPGVVSPPSSPGVPSSLSHTHSPSTQTGEDLLSNTRYGTLIDI